MSTSSTACASPPTHHRLPRLPLRDLRRNSDSSGRPANAIIIPRVHPWSASAGSCSSPQKSIIFVGMLLAAAARSSRSPPSPGDSPQGRDLVLSYRKSEGYRRLAGSETMASRVVRPHARRRARVDLVEETRDHPDLQVRRGPRPALFPTWLVPKRLECPDEPPALRARRHRDPDRLPQRLRSGGFWSARSRPARRLRPGDQAAHIE
jgi:hypothetical protein